MAASWLNDIMQKNFRSLISYLLLPVIVFSVTACQKQLDIGQTAPKLQVADLNNTPLTLSADNTKPTLLVFWSTSCGMCLADMRKIENFYRQHHEQLAVIAINIDNDSDKVKKTLATEEFTYPVVMDQLGISAARYEVTATPTLFILDAASRLIDSPTTGNWESALAKIVG